VQPETAHDSHITPAQFASAMATYRLEPGSRIAVAVSGGADSMALARLLATWANERRIFLQGLTVDHRLRDAAADEARQVGAWLASLNIPHEVLVWKQGEAHRALPGSAQSPAREARYDLMTAWCAKNDISHLFVAHHADDQVETFLLRLSRGSGVDGLAAMPAAFVRDGIVIARPLLAFSKAQMVATCQAQAQTWIEDPSNDNTASVRVRFRQSQEVLEREGLTRARLLATVGHLQRARAALDHAVAGLMDKVRWDDFAVARVPLADLLAAPEEIGLRALSRLLSSVGGQHFGPRFESLARLYAQMTAGPWSDATLHGCFIAREGEDIVIVREAGAVRDEQTLASQGWIIWDGRFKLTLSAVPVTLQIRAVADHSDLDDDLRTLLGHISVRVRGTFPVAYDCGGVAAVPHVQYVRADIAAIPGFSLGMTRVSAGELAL